MTKRTGEKSQTARSTKRGASRDSAPGGEPKAALSRGDLRERSARLWEGQSQSNRGPRPAVSRMDVVQAAIAIADEKGLAALTMHALAERLGFTTMAVYRYFPSKEALIDTIVDAALGSPPHRKGSKGDWRQDVKDWAHAKRAMLCSRPWLAELPFVAAPHGPNWLSWHEAFLQTISDTGLSPEDMMDMLSIVDGYVRGNSDTAISLARAQAQGISIAEWAEAVGADLARAINDPRYPVLSAILSSASGGISASSPLPARAGRPRSMDGSFDFGLDRVLDGIQLYMNPPTATAGKTEK